MPAATEEDRVTRTTPASERAALRTLHQRRWRVWRSVILFVLVTVGMVLVSMAQRDAQAVRRCHEHLQYAVGIFERDYYGQSLPLVFPQRPGGEKVVRSHYRYAAENANLLGEIRPVGICVCDRPHRLFLRHNGRHVVLFDGETFEIRWLEEPEYAERAFGFGFRW